MQTMARGGGIPGMPGVAGMGAGSGKRGKGKQPAKGRRRVSGNPAKAAAQQKAIAARAEKSAANPFGNPEEVDFEKAAQDLQLPKDFSKFLK
jgi:signal recognition particle subunit SRP54